MHALAQQTERGSNELWVIAEREGEARLGTEAPQGGANAVPATLPSAPELTGCPVGTACEAGKGSGGVSVYESPARPVLGTMINVRARASEVLSNDVPIEGAASSE